jgi:hypothetical protein
MGYSRFATPRAYTDILNYNLANGWRDLDDYTVKDGSSDVSFLSGNKEDLFDLKPHNFVTIASTQTSFAVQFDTGFGGNSLSQYNYLAILGHNFASANVVFNVQISDSSNFSGSTTNLIDGNGSGTGSGNLHTKIINAASYQYNDTYIDPANNGWTLLTFPAQTSTDNQYLKITFSSLNNSNQVDGTENYDANVVIGSICYGEFISWPHPMDVNVTTAYDYDGTTLHNSVGGSTYASSPHYGAPSWAVTNPWTNTTTSNQNTYGFMKRYGRKKHSMKFSHMVDTDVFSADQTADPGFFTGSDLHSQFYNKIIGQHIPFMWTLDETSTTPGDYSFYRLADSSFTARQVGSRVFDVNLDLIESW